MKYILAAFFVCLGWCNEVSAKELNVMFGGTRPPFHYIEDGKPKGIEIQLMQAHLVHPFTLVEFMIYGQIHPD